MKPTFEAVEKLVSPRQLKHTHQLSRRFAYFFEQSSATLPTQEHESVGINLHDHPTVAVSHAGVEIGHGLTLSQLPKRLLATFAYFFRERSFASNIYKADAFSRSAKGDGAPDSQMHLNIFPEYVFPAMRKFVHVRQ